MTMTTSNSTRLNPRRLDFIFAPLRIESICTPGLHHYQDSGRPPDHAVEPDQVLQRRVNHPFPDRPIGAGNDDPQERLIKKEWHNTPETN